MAGPLEQVGWRRLVSLSTRLGEGSPSSQKTRSSHHPHRQIKPHSNKMAIIVVTGSTGSRRDPSISSLAAADGPTSGTEDQQEKDSGCDPSDLWMLSPSAASVLCGHLPITSGLHSRHSSHHAHHNQVGDWDLSATLFAPPDRFLSTISW